MICRKNRFLCIRIDKKGEPQLVTLKVKESGKVQLEILPQGGVVLVNN